MCMHSSATGIIVYITQYVLPYMVSLASASTTQWKFTDNPSEREYIDLMATISKETYHRLPTSNFKGFITKGATPF